MKFDFYDGAYVGSAEWRAPGEVALEVPDTARRTFFETNFGAEDCYLTGSVDCPEMFAGRRDSSEETFARAALHLMAKSYDVRATDTEAAYAGKGTGPE